MQKTSSKESPLRIITTYRAQWEQVRNVLQKHWGILTKSSALTDIVGPRPQLVARRARNLNTLVHSEYTRVRTTNCLTDLPKECMHAGTVRCVDLLRKLQASQMRIGVGCFK